MYKSLRWRQFSLAHFPCLESADSTAEDSYFLPETSGADFWLSAFLRLKKGKGSPYSITERRVPELIPVLGSQPAGDVNHHPGGRLLLLSYYLTVGPYAIVNRTSETVPTVK